MRSLSLADREVQGCGPGNVVLRTVPNVSGPEVPSGFRIGHWSDRERWTGCTVILPPRGNIAACEVRGGGPGTRETDLLSPAAAAQEIHGVLLTGGSAFGLQAADGVVGYLTERGIGLETRAGLVPLVTASVVYDLPLGDPDARPGPEEGLAACLAADRHVDRGSVGVGTGCSVGKLDGSNGWTKGGLGLGSMTLSSGATVACVAAVNAFGEVLDADGSVLAGLWRDDAYVRTVALLAAGDTPARSWGESTTLVCVMTDAAMTKTQAWRVARAANAGIAQAVSPSATAVDGDCAYCVACGEVEEDPLVVTAVASEVTAVAIRDAVRSATGAPGCPAANDR